MTAEAGPILSAAPVTDLVMRARDGDQPAWGAIVERFAPLVWSICRRYRLANGHHQARMRPDRAASRLSTQFAY